mmetsp:Transcript_21008/g.53246  ORF Transcript_21008/g.53246 Transcript_21008/m.53246 type:complete len:82 (-) Transcript_21008:361-606(-)
MWREEGTWLFGTIARRQRRWPSAAPRRGQPLEPRGVSGLVRLLATLQPQWCICNIRTAAQAPVAQQRCERRRRRRATMARP